MQITFRDPTESDIDAIMDYWFNPLNLDYHNSRGGIDEAGWDLLRAQPERLRANTALPIAERKNTTAIILVDGRAIGHTLVNAIREPEKQRLHFHLWRHQMTLGGLGTTVSLFRYLVPAIVAHFTQVYDMPYVTGDVAVTNRPANFILQRLGYMPAETVLASYLGDTQEYNRYRFTHR